MNTLVEGAGIFIWPMGICSFLAAFIVIERLLALRLGRVFPEALLAAVASGNLGAMPENLEGSTGGRVVSFFQKNLPDAESLKAYARIELTRLERGLFLLDTIVGIAPLLGLLGTVYGLFILFPEQGLPDAERLTRGVGLALTTTMLGLFIAIPSLICSNYIARRIEIISARMNMLVERLIVLDAAKIGEK